MPETSDPEQDQEATVGSSNVQRQREHIKNLEAQLKEATAKAAAAEAAMAKAQELEAQVAGFTRNATFDRLGIPTTGPGKLFREAYQGELTDEVIVAKATEYGIVQPAPTGLPTIPGVDAAAMARMSASLGSATSSNGQTPSALAQLEQLRNSGASDAPEQALALLRQLGAVGEGF